MSISKYAMDLKTGTYLTAPNIKNVSCTHPRYIQPLYHYIGPFDVVQALIIFAITIGIIGANLMLIFVINHRRYSPYIHPLPRYLLTSLALNDFAIGILITPLGILPALFHCWPYGEIFCQIQALLRGALGQQSAVILICMAVDRYMCALHPEKYHQLSSKKGCVAILSVTWTLCLTVFGVLVLPKGYYFNDTGLLVCAPFYSQPSYRILATCSLYFPTTMILMYCYGSSFHASRFRLVVATPSNSMMHSSHPLTQSASRSVLHATTNLAIMTPVATVTESIASSSTSEKHIGAQEKRLSGSASRTMAAISLGFIVMVTPWTIQEVVAACTGSKVPPFLDFFITWIALSNSFWNPFLYWLLNAHFRRLSRELILRKCCFREESSSEHKLQCCSVSSDCDVNPLPLPPPPATRPISKTMPPHTDFDTLSEKYWGEILERTMSSSSLQALQRSHSEHNANECTIADSVAEQYHQLGCFKCSANDLSNGYHYLRHQQFTNGTLRATHKHDKFIDKQTRMLQKNNTNLANFSNSEPHLCDHYIHDINCAKNELFYKDEQSNKDSSNM